MAGGNLAAALALLSDAELQFLEYDWELWARDDQLEPLLLAPLLLAPGDSRSASRPPGAEHASGGRFSGGESPDAKKEAESPGARKRVWLLLGGRGSGKTRAGAEWVRGIATAPSAAGVRIALVGKTLADVRNVMIEGASGLLTCHRPIERPLFEPSKRRITWPTGAVAEMFSADEREALRGPQFSHAWCDEIAKWREAQAAWDMLQFGLRLGSHPRVVATTTPRSTAFLKGLIGDAGTVTTRLATADNADNLAPTFLAEMTRRYAGSVLGRQELLGEIIEDTAQALWRRHWIEDARAAAAPELARIVVALDPPVTATASSDACGIIVAALGVDGRAYVLADRTIQGRTPEVWARAALTAYDDFAADRLVAEVNQGGDLVVSVLQQFRENLPVTKVRATRGKWVRAEPVAALYAEGRVAHAGRFEHLEDQMCAFGADGLAGGRSPDRVDALVWAITDLLLSETARPSIRPL